MAESTIAVGVFRDPAQAHKAVEELRQAGYSDEEIGYLARVRAPEPDESTSTTITSGVVEGGLVGGLLGAAVALLIPGFGLAIAGGVLAVAIGGAAVGAAAGGLLGVLIGIGLPEEEARYYQKELAAGHTVITVKAESGYADALEILRRNGAYNATTRFGEINAIPPIRPFGSSKPDSTTAEASET
ncbi:MAG TPA: hypothetical protein VF725_09525 [Ktedonobacterales bacterium]